MAKFIPANEPATFKVNFKGIQKDAYAARFQIFSQQGSEQLLDDLEGELADGQATLVWTAKGPPVDGPDRSWRVQYIVTVPGANGQDIQKVSEELIVFNNWLDISAINVEDKSPVSDAPYEIQIGKGDPLKGNTGQSGTFKEEAIPAGDIDSFKWLRWAKFEGWAEERGVVRKAKIRICKRARIASPELSRKDGKPRELKQYVNLAPNPERAHYGPKLTIKVELANAKKGDKIYCKVEFDTETKRNDVERRIHDGIADTPEEPRPGWCKQGGKIVEIEDEENATAEFSFDVGHAGGSVATISVGGNENCDDDQLVVTNWRRVFYQITRTRDVDSPSLKRVTQALADVFVQLAQYDTLKVTPGDPDDAPKGSWFPASDLGGPPKAKYLNIGDGNRDYWHQRFRDTYAPHGLHVLFCHTQYDTLAANCEKTFRVSSFTKLDLEEANAEDGGKVPWKGEKVWGLGYHPGKGFEILPTCLRDGSRAFRSGKWSQVGGEGLAGELKEEDLDFVDGGFKLKLPADAVKVLLTDTQSLAVEIKCFAAKGPFLADSNGAQPWLQLVALRGRSGARKCHISTVNDALAHEIGHLLRLTAQALPPGLKPEDHGRQYSGNGHAGAHCADGMDEANYGAGSGAGDYAANFEDRAECRCVMYGQNDPKESRANGSFCPRCQVLLKAEKIDTLHRGA